jgi:hypothetical protein
MAYNSIAEIFAANEAAQAQFAAVMTGLTNEQANFRPADDRWTIAEIAEHVGIVNDGFLRITHKLLKQAEAAGKPPKNTLNAGYTSLNENGGQNSTKFSAPDRVKPQGDVTIETALARMRETLDGFNAIRSRIEATDLSEEKFPHPAFGEINAYQWMILLGEHQDRHLAQVEAVKRTAGFPA